MSGCRIAQFEGISPISKTIKHVTKGPDSHSAPVLPDGTLIEAWHRGGVIHTDNISQIHTPGTRVRIYRLPDDFNEEPAIEWALSIVGDKYDFKAIPGFLIGKRRHDPDKWFCSELTHKFAMIGGILLQNTDSHLVSPRDNGISPVLTLEKVIYA